MSTQTPVQPDLAPSTGPPPPPPPRQRSSGALLLGFVLVGAGVLWLLAALGVDIPVAVVTPAVLITLGLAVLVSALRGGDSAAIGFAVFIGVWLTLAALVTLVADVPLSGAVGDHDIAPAVAADLEDSYRLFAGTQTVDLRDLQLPEGTTEVEVSTVLGQVEVVVPDGMAVHVDAGVAGGQIDLFGTAIDGVGLDDTAESDTWSEVGPRIDLRLRVGLGEILVRSD